MGSWAAAARKRTAPAIRAERLTPAERDFLKSKARYEGSPLHKRSPGDFGLTPPSSPRPDKTLCDEAGLYLRAKADALLARAIDGGLVSEATAADGFPKRMWAVEGEHVFEAIYGGASAGCYHGYPVRRSDPFFDEVLAKWNAR